MILKSGFIFFMLINISAVLGREQEVTRSPYDDSEAYKLTLQHYYLMPNRDKIQTISIRVDESFTRYFIDQGSKLRITDFPNVTNVRVYSDYSGIFERHETTAASMLLFNQWMSNSDSLNKPIHLIISSNFKIDPIHNISDLTIYNHKTLDSSLYGLKNITQLNVSGDFVSEFDFQPFVNVERLGIGVTNQDIFDLERLSEYKNLKNLRIVGDSIQIIDLKPLKNSANLKELSIYLPLLKAFDFRDLESNQQLQLLHLESDSLETITWPSIAMSSVYGIKLSSKKLRVFPPGFGQFTQIGSLELRTPSLDSISPDLFASTTLVYLEIEKSSLSQIPAEIGQLINLYNLVLAVENPMINPEIFSNLRDLEFLYIYQPTSYDAGKSYKRKQINQKLIRRFKRVLPKECNVFVERSENSELRRY